MAKKEEKEARGQSGSGCASQVLFDGSKIRREFQQS